MKIFKILLLSAFALSLHAAPIYVYKDGSGAVKFTSKKPTSGGVKFEVFQGYKGKVSYYDAPNYGKKKGSYSYSWKKTKINPAIYQATILSAAKRHGIASSLVKAVIHAESAFNPRAVSSKGAMGLMQLMPENARRYGVKNPFAATQNIEGGTKLLSRLMRKYKGNIKLAAAAYNAGEGAVQKYGGIPPYSETRNYVKKVVSLYNRYQS